MGISPSVPFYDSPLLLVAAFAAAWRNLLLSEPMTVISNICSHLKASYFLKH